MKKILLLLAIPLTLSAQKSAGYLDQNSIILLMPEYQIASDILEKRGKELSDTMDIYLSFSENITYAFVDCQALAKNNNNSVDSTKLKECEDIYNTAMLKYEADIEAYRTYATGSYEKQSYQLNENLYIALQAKVNEFCTQRKIQFLTDKASLLYCPKCKDYTEEFIKFMQQK